MSLAPVASSTSSPYSALVYIEAYFPSAPTTTTVQQTAPPPVNTATTDQTINGTASNDYLMGGSGNDTINGSARNDTLVVGAGSDTVIGGTGWGTATDTPAVNVSHAGLGDYNGDGRTDILWQSADGSLKAEMVNGLSIAASGTVAAISADWVVA